MKETIKMDRIEDAIADFKEGKFVIVVDDEDHYFGSIPPRVTAFMA